MKSSKEHSSSSTHDDSAPRANHKSNTSPNPKTGWTNAERRLLLAGAQFKWDEIAKQVPAKNAKAVRFFVFVFFGPWDFGVWVLVSFWL